MQIPQSGNGSGAFDVGAHDMGGWVRVLASETGMMERDLPVYLAHRLAELFREHPHLILTSTVPITKDGRTVELYGFYQQHVFRDQAMKKLSK